MKEKNVKEILYYFEEKCGDKITLMTEINNDLEFVGDDADYLIQDFSKRFKVNMSEFPFSKYFVPELVFKYWYFKWFKPEKLKKIPLTIAHMSKVAEKGEWFDPR